jgi:hypothetical protein
LLGYGADIESLNRQNLKPAALAVQAGHNEISTAINQFRPKSGSFMKGNTLPPPDLSVPPLTGTLRASAADLKLPASPDSEEQVLERQKADFEKQIADLKKAKEEATARGDIKASLQCQSKIHETEVKIIEIEEKLIALEEQKLSFPPVPIRTIDFYC